MQALDNVDWGHADGGDEEFSAGVDDYGHQFVELSFCVVVAVRILRSAVAFGIYVQMGLSTERTGRG